MPDAKQLLYPYFDYIGAGYGADCPSKADLGPGPPACPCHLGNHAEVDGQH